MADEIIGRISVGDGATFTPSVDSDGVISWTNNKNLPNPESVDIPQVVVDRYQLAPTSNPTFTGTVTAEDITASGTITGDLTGNVTGNVTGTASGNLPLSGGTMTGAISTSYAQALRKTDSNDYIQINSGVVTADGSSLVMCAKGYSGGIGAGVFQLTARDSNDYKILYGKPDGTLTWGGQSIPERSYGVSLTSTAGENTYTFSVNTNGAVIFAKRGSVCSCHMVDYWTSGSVKIFSTATDPITITKSANSNSVTITNAYSSAVAIKILNGGAL